MTLPALRRWDPYHLSRGLGLPEPPPPPAACAPPPAASAERSAPPQQQAPAAAAPSARRGTPVCQVGRPAPAHAQARPSPGVRAPTGAPPRAQVEFCDRDLTTSKEYHQRYKICEFHLKLHSIVREGARQRFCQQCGRFHPLDAFDGDKRSCRARLERHNARRRKKVDAPDERGPAKKARTSGWCPASSSGACRRADARRGRRHPVRRHPAR